MQFKVIIFFLACFILSEPQTFAQTKFLSSISVVKQMKDTFSFKKHWDYSWEVFKDDSTKGFSRNDGQRLKSNDTAHLFYTANCHTNVQGGYRIRYCYGSKKGDKIVLTFSDGLPAYASAFYVFIKNDSFYFEPNTVYPVISRGQKISYRVDKEELSLNKSRYTINEIIIGYANFKFTEIVSLPGKRAQERKLYLRGYFRTPLKEENRPYR